MILKGFVFLIFSLLGVVLFSFQFSKGTDKSFTLGLIILAIGIALGTIFGRLV